MSIFISLNVSNVVVILFYSELSVTQFHPSGCFKQSQHGRSSYLLSKTLYTLPLVPINKGEAVLTIFHLSPSSEFLFCFWTLPWMWANLYGMFGSVDGGGGGLVSKSCLTLVTLWTVACQASVHRIFQARILEWIVISFSKGSSWPRDRIHGSCIACVFFTTEPSGKSIWVGYTLTNLYIYWNG